MPHGHKTTDNTVTPLILGLVHRVLCMCTPELLLLVVARTHGVMARLN